MGMLPLDGHWPDAVLRVVLLFWPSSRRLDLQFRDPRPLGRNFEHFRSDVGKSRLSLSSGTVLAVPPWLRAEVVEHSETQEVPPEARAQAFDVYAAHPEARQSALN